MKTLVAFAVLLTSLLASSRADDLQGFNAEFTRFHLAPTRAKYDSFQADADELAGALKNKGNRADLLTAVFIARAAEKYHWPIRGKSAIADTAREIAAGRSKLAWYILTDSVVDLAKLDIWWSSFFSTGETRYPAKVLNYVSYPVRGEHTASFMIPAMAAWSFKSNCRQDPTVMAFARKALAQKTFPQKTAFLRNTPAHPALS